ncbi:phage baseplate assembly protein V [Flammeovirga aprica]|uniref:Gp5/Type VI secretion system Vgr protein OB-fold domain-containing protein n=1 Tax=Flammeovirga aprica JL-4 TaxID=694437 RepID=A0A7X9XB21_9BACT|nr:phage baseplate assembly protein V [Flammeovirga aprica]NME70271.1 hypothetical protein [Flammeovirga aprica JL-4]
MTKKNELYNTRTEVRIEANGSELELYAYQLKGLSINYSVNDIPYCSITLMNARRSTDFSSLSELYPSSEVKIYAKNEYVDEVLLFEGVVSKYGTQSKGRRFMSVIEVLHPVFRLKRRVINRLFALSLPEVVDKIFSDYELTVSNQMDIEEEESESRITQYQQNDFDFVLSKIKQAGCMFCPSAEELSVKDVLEDGTPKMEIDPIKTTRFNVFMDIEDLHDIANINTYNVEDMAVEQESSESVSFEAGDASVDSATVSGALDIGPQEIISFGQENTAIRKKWLTNKIQESKLGKVKGGITIEGTNDVMPGDFITIVEAGSILEGDAFVYGVEQHLESDNWKTTLLLGLPKEENKPQATAGDTNFAITGLQHGIVKKVQSSDDQHATDQYLVQVELPLLMQTDMSNDVEPLVWARLASFYAGEAHGTLWLPELEDEVVVGFLGGHPDNPIILGSIFKNSDEHPHVGTEGYKSIVTKSNLQLAFDDENELIHLHSESAHVTLDEANGILHLKVTDGDTVLTECILDKENNININSPDGEVNINADKISLTAASEMKLESASSLSIDGQEVTVAAAAKLGAEAGTMLELKGTQVFIN